MAALSDFAENGLLNHLFKVSSLPQPTHLYVALLAAAPTDAGGGTEVSGNAYARVQCDSWTTAVAGSVANAADLTYPTPSGSWGLITHFAIYDASSGGNLIAWGALTASQTIVFGNSVVILAGDLVITLD